MSDFLFGGEKSGTPQETRAATADLAGLFQRMIRDGTIGGLSPTSRMSSESWINMLGFDPSALGLGDVAQDLLRSPADQTSGLFSSLTPFEERETGRQVAGLRELFGTMGGRFGRNIGEAEAELRGELSDRFLRTRQEGLLSANAQRAQLLASLIPSIIQSRALGQDQLRIAAQFLSPGSPVITEGVLPGLIGAGTNIAGLALLGRGLFGGDS